MRAFIPAIALCAALHAAAAPQPMAHAGGAMAAAAHGELHAQLVTPADGLATAQRRSEVGVKTSLQSRGTGPADEGQEHRPTTAAMLLAALALMTGIAVRRWGAGQQ